MSQQSKPQIPILLLPFYALWRFIAWIVGFTGRVVAVVLGLGLMIVGVVLTALFVTAFIGIPLIIIGLLLIIRGIF